MYIVWLQSSLSLHLLSSWPRERPRRTRNCDSNSKEASAIKFQTPSMRFEMDSLFNLGTLLPDIPIERRRRTVLQKAVKSACIPQYTLLGSVWGFGPAAENVNISKQRQLHGKE